jgi:hypothetical protein
MGRLESIKVNKGKTIERPRDTRENLINRGKW